MEGVGRGRGKSLGHRAQTLTYHVLNHAHAHTSTVRKTSHCGRTTTGWRSLRATRRWLGRRRPSEHTRTPRVLRQARRTPAATASSNTSPCQVCFWGVCVCACV